MADNSNLDERIEKCLLTLSEHFDREDFAVRERQLRIWRRLKLYWNSFSNVFYSEVAHDWRTWDREQEGSTDQSYYDKPLNVFRAYLESIIAALSVTIPSVKCYPDDAENPQDIETAHAGDKIYDLISKHNKTSLLWLHALYTMATEGMIAAYTYTDENEKYGSSKEDITEEVEMQAKICPVCQTQIADPVLSNRERNEFDPGDDDVKLQNELEQSDICPQCGALLDPEMAATPLIITRIVGTTNKAKTRQCIEVYGGLYVKIPNYIREQKDLPYLRFSYECHYAQAYEKYQHLKGKFDDSPQKTTGYYGDPYEAWARLSPQYNGDMPIHNVTINQYWFRPYSYNVLNDDDTEFIKKKFPNGCKFVKVNDCPAEACNESLDDHWTIASNPLSDYLHYDPTGTLLVSVQDITNDIVSLVLQTIEHGIPQTFADPAVLNFDEYRQTETAPGLIYPATPKSGKSVGDGFYEVKTATLSGEILPFAQNIQSMGQLVSGALPSLFGGASSQGSQTASEYSMSRAQALQRLQNSWKMLSEWWKDIHGKVIPQFIKTMVGDEKYVEKDENNNFINVFVRRSELQGKLGQIELETSEQLPQSWAQKRDAVMELIKLNNPELLQLLASPENMSLIKEAVGLTEFIMPGEADREKEFEDIQLLVTSEPIVIPPQVDPMMVQANPQMAMDPNIMQMMQPQELPSVEVDPELDNHAIAMEIDRAWLIGPAGRLAKQENPPGYKNVLLHFKAHQQAMQMQQMQASGMMAPPGQPANEPPPPTPIQGESDAQRFTPA